MYCENCQCDFCQAQRAAGFSEDKVVSEVIRLAMKAGATGLTVSQLKIFSRHFRKLDAQAQTLLLDQLIMSGVLIKHSFPAPIRGKPREAFLASKLSQ